MKKKILIIGNVGDPNEESFDGGAIKTKLYMKLLQETGHEVFLVNVFKWKRHFFSLVLEMMKKTKQSDRIILMAGPNGCRLLLPIITTISKKKELVFCPLGIGTLDKKINRLTLDQQQSFYFNYDYHFFQDRLISRCLKKLDLVILQNDILRLAYENFYHLTNCVVLQNFRNIDILTNRLHNQNNDSVLHIVYVSRVNQSKGILDLVECVNEVNGFQNNQQISLDIYGSMQLSGNDFKTFSSSLNSKVQYHGELSNEHTIDTIGQYDLFAFPTKYHGEGTPGALVESLLAGTPVLLSSFPFRKAIIRGPESIVFEIGNKHDLTEKLNECRNNIQKIRNMRAEATETGALFTFQKNRSAFLSYIGGDE